MMFKRSASRTQRSKGFVRAKQILQILVLLGICFWLVYQVKYSSDKKKAILDEKDSKISQKELDGLKSGRKELLPRVFDKQHSAAEEDEDEHEEIDESNVHDDGKKANEEVEELEEEEEEEAVKNDEPGNHKKPGEVEVEEGEEDHEEFIDEEKDKEDDSEGNGEEVKNDEDEDEDEDGDGVSREAHEAQEEHYKGDDASSAVTRDTVEMKELDKSSVSNNESTTVEIDEKNPESGNSNDHATDVGNKTELGNAAAVNSTATSDPELVESSLDHSEDTSLVESDSNLRLPSNTTGSSETNTQAGGVETD